MKHINLKINELAEFFFNGNNSKFAKKFNTSETNIRNYRKNIIPKVDFIIKLYELLEINFEWILLDQGPMTFTHKDADVLRAADYHERINELKAALYDKEKIIAMLETENSTLRKLSMEALRDTSTASL